MSTGKKANWPLATGQNKTPILASGQQPVACWPLVKFNNTGGC